MGWGIYRSFLKKSSQKSKSAQNQHGKRPKSNKNTKSAQNKN
jgi:hypothetical protein